MTRLRSLLRNLFRKREVERELADEVRAAAQILEQENIAAGMPPQEARRAAEIELGGSEQIRENVREVSAGMLLEQFAKDVRFGLRQMRRNAGFATVAIITLALGIAANSVIFSVVNAVMLRPLPFGEPDRLVRVYESNEARGWPQFSMSQPNFLDFRALNRSFEKFAASTGRGVVLPTPEGPENIIGRAVSAEFFDVLGITPSLGRNFLPEEDQGTATVAIVTHGFWTRRLGSDPQIAGKPLTVADRALTIIGVLPQSFEWGEAEIFLPLGASLAASRGDHRLSTIGKLKPGVTLLAAAQDMQAIAARLGEQYPESNKGWSVRLLTFMDWLVPQEFRTSLKVLQGAVALVLLIACANVANLLMARATARNQEVAVRVALGAGRARLVRQMLTESVMLGALGGATGLLLARWALAWLRAANPDNIPRIEEITLDWRVALFTVAVSVATGIIFGLAPAFQISRARVHDALKEGGRGADQHGGRQKMRSALVVAEVAVSLMLLVGAGLLIRSFWEVQNVRVGYNPEDVITLPVNLPGSRYPTAAQSTAFYHSFFEQIGALPGVKSVGATSIAPLGGGNTAVEINVDGQDATDRTPSANWRLATFGYFKTVGIPLLSGQDFEYSASPAQAQSVIVSESFARRFWPNENAVGKRFWDRGTRRGDPYTVIGVVGDVRDTGLEADPWPTFYYSNAVGNMNPMWVTIRTDATPATMSPLLREILKKTDANIPLGQVESLQALMDRSLAPRRFNLVLLVTFAGVALVMAAIGLFGVMAYLVAQRTHEIGLRLALGAQRGNILRLILGRGMMLTLIGVAAGLIGAFSLNRVMRDLLFGVTSTDAVTYLAVAALLTGVAALACYLPAYRATRVDPLVALRYE